MTKKYLKDLTNEEVMNLIKSNYQLNVMVTDELRYSTIDRAIKLFAPFKDIADIVENEEEKLRFKLKEPIEGGTLLEKLDWFSTKIMPEMRTDEFCYALETGMDSLDEYRRLKESVDVERAEKAEHNKKILQEELKVMEGAARRIEENLIQDWDETNEFYTSLHDTIELHINEINYWDSVQHVIDSDFAEGNKMEEEIKNLEVRMANKIINMFIDEYEPPVERVVEAFRKVTKDVEDTFHIYTDTPKYPSNVVYRDVKKSVGVWE